MNLGQLEYLVAACEERSISAAARRVHVSQQSLSAAIAQLESELGCSLLERTSRGVHPTEAGLRALPYARAALAAVDGLRLAASELRQGQAARLAFAFVPEIFESRGAGFARQTFAAFERQRPGARLDPLSCQPDACIASVRDGTCELGIVSADPDNPRLRAQLVFACPAVLFVPRGHPLAARERVSFEDLRGVPFAPPPNGSYPMLEVVRHCRRHGFEPSFEDAARPGDGDGVALMPAIHEEVERSETHLAVPFVEDDEVRLALWAITRADTDPSPLAHAFVDYLGASFRALAQ